ncbi:response regulator [Corynebacterium kozikiae]|uniref:response regulator n=1 Tax=Corynebacterium kozikiae TaxID=2968469 RepID=UPI00211C78F7|nr:response regulator transcription factor [Corynebacterium sp. 76QC2CO]MCQ9344091.1 response regulator transcription factor [Corynebacterium sp. 76QC2CO]
MAEKIRILVADDQPLMASALKTILDSHDRIEVVATCADGREAIDLAAQWRIDVAILDIEMPRMDGLEAARRLLLEHDNIRVLMLTTFSANHLVACAIEAGVHGFLLKDVDPKELIDSVLRVYDGASILSPEVTSFVMSEFRNRSPLGSTISEEDELFIQSLTAREKDVLRRVAKAETNAEIAENLYISTATVKTYISRLINKLGVRDRVGLAVWVHETKLIDD